MTGPRLIGIFGTGRNGNTLLTRLLDGVDGVYVHPVESNFLCAMNDLAWRPTVSRRVIQNAVRHRLTHLDRTIPMRRLLRFYGAHMRELEHDYIPLVAPIALGTPAIERLRKQRFCTPVEFVPFFLDAVARWTGADHSSHLVVFKSIETPYIADYGRLFPHMRFIHIIRDPVEVWASSKRSLVSYKKLPPWHLGTDYLRTTIDRRWLPHAEAIVARMDSPRHFIVRYEDLINRPSEIERNICVWLGTPPPAEPDTQTLPGGRHPTEIPDNLSQRGVRTPRRAVADLHANHRFEDVVSARERDLIVYATYGLATRLGYFKTLQRPDPAEVRRQWRSIDEWNFRHVAGALSWFKALRSLSARRQFVWRCCRRGSG